MNIGDKPDLLISHGPNCLDGLGAIWAITTKWPDVPHHLGIYGEAPPDVAGLNVLIADFSYPEDVLRKMAKKAKGLIVLDHHRTSAEWIPKLDAEGVIKGVHDETQSGAVLAYTYAWGRHSICPKLLLHVQDRDLWKFEIEGTREVTAVLSSWGSDMAAWSRIGRDIENGSHAIIHAEGRAIMRQRAQDIATLIRASVRQMAIGGHVVPVVNAPFFWASEVGHELAQGQPFAATYMDMADGQRQFSLRSRDGLPVNEIAEAYGGGGHPGAAGFTAAPGWEGEMQVEPVQTVPLNKGGAITVEA